MKKLLDGKLPVPPGIFAAYRPSSHGITLSNLNRDISEYLKWRRTDVIAVPEDHWLVSYLIVATSKLGYSLNLTPQESFSKSDFASEELARAFGFTTEYNAGRLHIGDNGAVTVYVIGRNQKERDRITAQTPYWDMTAMRYISHGSTNFSMGSHAEPEEFVGSGFDVVEIDLSILHWQTLTFMSYWAANSDSPRTIRMMVAMDVLPRMKMSQYGIAFMNRMACIANGLPVNDSFFRLPKSFPDRHTEINRYLKELVDGLLKRDMSFEEAIGSIPTVQGVKSLDLLSMDDYSYSRQINWAILVARASLLEYLVALCRIDPVRSSRWPVNDIKRSIARVLGDNGLSAAMSLTIRREFKVKLDRLLDQM